MSTEELPEHQIFTILRDGEETPEGPYSQNQIVELLNEGQLRRTDFVFYEGLESWRQISEIFEIHEGIANFEDDGQDRHILAEVFVQVTQLVSEKESIYYIAVQDKQGVRFKGPDAVVVTEYRLGIAHQRLTGKREFDMYYWDDVSNTSTRISADDATGTFIIVLHGGDRLEVQRIPRLQLERIAELSKELRSSGNQRQAQQEVSA